MSSTLTCANRRGLVLMKWASLCLIPMTVVLLATSTNHTLFMWLNSHLSLWTGPSLWALLTNMGDGFFLFPLGMLLVRLNPEKQQALIISMILAAIALNGAKFAIDLDRPAAALNHAITIIGPEVRSHSMPSGHSGTIFLLAGLTALFANTTAIVSVFVLASLCALSRVVVGAHWPADVLAGAWIGLFCAVLGNMIASRLKPGLAIRAFYIALGLIATIILAFYNNGFENYTGVRFVQYSFVVVAFVLSLSELHSLTKALASHRQAVKASDT